MEKEDFSKLCETEKVEKVHFDTDGYNLLILFTNGVEVELSIDTSDDYPYWQIQTNTEKDLEQKIYEEAQLAKLLKSQKIQGDYNEFISKYSSEAYLKAVEIYKNNLHK